MDADGDNWWSDLIRNLKNFGSSKEFPRKTILRGCVHSSVDPTQTFTIAGSVPQNNWI